MTSERRLERVLAESQNHQQQLQDQLSQQLSHTLSSVLTNRMDKVLRDEMKKTVPQSKEAHTKTCYCEGHVQISGTELFCADTKWTVLECPPHLIPDDGGIAPFCYLLVAKEVGRIIIFFQNVLNLNSLNM